MATTHDHGHDHGPDAHDHAPASAPNTKHDDHGHDDHGHSHDDEHEHRGGPLGRLDDSLGSGLAGHGVGVQGNRGRLASARGPAGGAAARELAGLGGHLGRKCDGEPGWITLWRGLEKLLLILRGADAERRRKCG